MGEMQIESKSQLLTRPRRPALTVKDFKGKADPDWCPGCGDFGVLNALKTAVAELGLLPHEVLTISGIGCSSNLPGYINTYGMHTLHGRALAVASGAQLGNHQLKVVVTGGDGDGFGIGGNHFVHVMRRNVDLTYIVMDNQIYGLTTGQVSPTSRKGMKTKSTPFARGGEWGETIPIGLFYKNDEVPALDELEPVLAEGGALARRPLEISKENARALVEELL